MKNNMKKKILVVAFVAIVLVMSIASTTIAYFTDNGEVENEFTVGKVDIDLTTTIPNENGKLYPTKVIDGGANIKVTADSESAYVGAIITISSNNDLTKLFSDGADGYLPTVIKLNDDCRYVVNATDEGTIVIYVVAKTALNANQSIQLFNNVTIPGPWTNEDMELLRDKLKINVKAFAVQSVGIESVEGEELALTALKAGFDVFDNVELP